MSSHDAPATSARSREDWLHEILAYIRPHFESCGYKVPANIRVSCGWTSRGARSGQKLVVAGECWAQTCSKDDTHEIFISPRLDDAIRVCSTLVHEVVHAVVGVKAGHRKPFSQCAAAVGLTKPWTATGETDELLVTMASWIEAVGPYPHASLLPKRKDGDKCRMLKLECSCGLKIRSTRKWVDQYGDKWPCPCGRSLVLVEEDADAE